MKEEMIEFSTSLDSEYLMDKELESQGVYFTVGTAKFLIRRYDPSVNQVRKQSEVILKKHVRKIKSGDITPEEAAAIERELFVKTAVLGWEGIKDKNGEDIPFSHDNCIALFKRLPELQKDLEKYATDRDNYKAIVGE